MWFIDVIGDLAWDAALAALGVTWFAQWLLQPVATRLNLLDHPKGRKDHASPTPVTGGIAMGLGVVLAALVFSPEVGDGFLGFLGAAAIILFVGLLDDLYDLRWTWRVMAQIVAALVMIYGGDVRVEQLGPVLGLESVALGWLSVPFTIFATVGLINAVNMVDGVDGLAGTVVWCALLMLAAAALYAGNHIIADRLMILMGAVAAFLAFNLRLPWRQRAVLFMGNAGSAFLGLVVAWFSFRLTQNPGHPVSPVLALWFVPIPVMDTLVVMLRRIRNKRSPFYADRNHIHHLMRDAHYGHLRVVVALGAFSLICGFLASLAVRADVPEPLLLIAFFVMCFVWYAITAKRERAIRFFRWFGPRLA
jgi:UDP-GlcNAc:undecaprenyl-phosphate/decaprenyl-phosphate GlcNAc-1-phosphate transferase